MKKRSTRSTKGSCGLTLKELLLCDEPRGELVIPKRGRSVSAVRARLERLEISEADVADAVAWAREGK